MPKIVSTTRGLCQFTTHGINKLLERNITNHVRKIASQSISKRMEFESPKLWIDCDAGVDDAQGRTNKLETPLLAAKLAFKFNYLFHSNLA